MTQEEKTKAYDEMTRLLSNWYKNETDIVIIDHISAIYPELAESEDERVRKWLINLVKNHIKYLKNKIREQLSNGQIYGGELDKANDSLAWLEKQGEQKKSNKNIVEIWKNMRLEVYQQASGNRHEPNCSDDTTKMFSLNDIDEIIEKVAEQKPIDTSQDLSAFKAQLKEYLLEEGWSKADPIYLDEAVDYKAESLLAFIPGTANWSEEDEKDLQRIKLHVSKSFNTFAPKK